MPGDVMLPVMWESIESELMRRVTTPGTSEPRRSARPTLAGLASAAALAVTVVTVGLTVESPADPAPVVQGPGYESRIPADDLVIFDFDDPLLLPAENVR